MRSRCCRGGAVKPVGSTVTAPVVLVAWFAFREHRAHCQRFLFLGQQRIFSFWEGAALPLYEDLVISLIAGRAGLMGACHCLGSAPAPALSIAASPCASR